MHVDPISYTLCLMLRDLWRKLRRTVTVFKDAHGTRHIVIETERGRTHIERYERTGDRP